MNTKADVLKVHPMAQYHDLMRRALDEGVVQHNVRTGIDCHVLPGAQLQFDLRDGFPLVTTKRIYTKSFAAELLGFFRGYTSAAQFRQLGTKIWDKNANETAAWLANPHRKGHDDLGRIYSVQWTAWRDTRVARTAEARDAMLSRGYSEILHDVAQGAWMMERGINQVENCLHTILTNPSDRRILVNGWRPDEFDQMVPPPCHNTYAFIPMADRRELHLVMSVRSWDIFLGGPFNIASSALFLELMARLAGYTAATLTIQAANAHVYANHVKQVHEQLSRDHYPQPRILIADDVRPIEDADQVSGAFTRIEPGHISFQDYQYHPAIEAPMAA